VIAGVTPRKIEAKIRAALARDLFDRLEALENGRVVFGTSYCISDAQLDFARYRLAQTLALQSEDEQETFFHVYALYLGGQTACVFCETEFTTLANIEAVADRLLHGRCAREHQAVMDAIGASDVTANVEMAS
jgi:hypothetical protein